MNELLVLSHHANDKHEREKWKAETILKAYERGQLTNAEHLTGTTADVFIAKAPDGAFVGLVISKVQPADDRHNEPYRVVITGFAASESYWRKQAG